MQVYTVHIMNNQEKEDTVTLEILQTIEKKEDFTQRHLANRLDVALGLALLPLAPARGRERLSGGRRCRRRP